MYILIKKSGWLRQKYHFVVVAINGKVLCCSENYYNLQDCQSAAMSVRGRNQWTIEYNWNFE